MSTSALAGLIEQNHAELLAGECRVLVLAAAWADRHYLDPSGRDYHPLVERACAFGGAGTPEVSEYCAAELGALQGVGMWAARLLIADALDLRYRLPRLWDRVQTGGVRAWQARKVAEATRCLSWEAASNLDHALSDCVGMMPWPRFRKILDAAVLDADPDLADQRAERARRSQDVYSFDSEDGLKTIVAKATAGDAVWFVATINRIAEILAARGDTDPIGARRARAVGILARPADALHLLIVHHHDNDATDEAPSGDPPEDLPEDLPDDPRDDPVEDADHVSLSLRAPAGFDAAAARPRVVLHFHLTEDALKHSHAIVRPEHGEPLTINQLVEFLTDTGCQIKVRWQDPATAPSPTAAGRSISPNPATTSTAHPADTSTSSPTKAPSHCAALDSAKPSGMPPKDGRSQSPPSSRPRATSHLRVA